MGFVDVNGIALAFDEAGGGELTPLVFVHGHPFDRTMWRPQLQAFAGSGRRLLAADLRGYGQSETTPGKVGLDVFAGDVDALLTARGVEGPVVVCGLSMGGQIAMEVCRRFPERVAGLVLAATTPQAETEAGKRARCAMADRLLAEGLRPYADETLAKMLSAESIAALPQVAAHVLSMMHRSGPAGAAAALRGRAERPDYQSTLAELAAPALVVAGDQDAFTTRADAERMHALLQGFGAPLARRRRPHAQPREGGRVQRRAHAASERRRRARRQGRDQPCRPVRPSSSSPAPAPASARRSCAALRRTARRS